VLGQDSQLLWLGKGFDADHFGPLASFKDRHRLPARTARQNDLYSRGKLSGEPRVMRHKVLKLVHRVDGDHNVLLKQTNTKKSRSKTKRGEKEEENRSPLAFCEEVEAYSSQDENPEMVSSYLFSVEGSERDSLSPLRRAMRICDRSLPGS